MFRLPAGRHWKTIRLSSDGNTLWALDGHGSIESFSYFPSQKTWNQTAVLTPSLWKEPDIAVTFLMAPDRNTFYMLDVSGCVHQWSRTPSDDTFTRVELKRHYNPNRPIMKDLVFWEEMNQFLLIDQFGRVVYQPAMDQEEDGAAPFEAIQSAIHYVQEKGEWIPIADIAAAEILPEANTLLQLHRDGVIEPILLPHGVRIRFRFKDLIIPTDVSSTLNTLKML